MADFAPNATSRYKAHYNVVGRPHTIQVRFARNAIIGDIVSNCRNYLNAIFAALAGAICDDFAFTGAEAAVSDSDLFFPVTAPVSPVGGIPIATYTKQDSITHLTFSGRGPGGSKINQKIYGIQFNPDTLPATSPEDFVVLATENAFVSAAIGAFNAGPAGIVAIDNTRPIYHQRATVKINDFWLRQVRKGL